LTLWWEGLSFVVGTNRSLDGSGDEQKERGMTELLQDPARSWNDTARAKVEAAGVRVGDRVRELDMHGVLGGYGVLVAVDAGDGQMTFKMRFDGDSTTETWVYGVRGESDDPAKVLQAGEVSEREASLAHQVETLEGRVARLTERATAAERARLAVEAEVREFRRAVSEEAYRIVEERDIPCLSGMTAWLEDHSCPTKAQTFKASVTITFDVSGAPDEPGDDVDDRWLQDLVDAAELTVRLDDYEVDNWNIGSVDVSAETEWTD
jgi:DNA-binding Lrp family transcriptional regulator